MEGQVNRLTRLALISSACLMLWGCAGAPPEHDAVGLFEGADPVFDGDVVYLFTSFRGNGDGLHYAWSEDGKVWEEIPGVFLDPQIGAGLMRDPDIERGPDGVYHLVWTTGWADDGIGYARSADLRNWSEPRYLPFMKGVEGVRNSWAPELFYDAAGNGGDGRFLITWSSDVEGRFPETKSGDRMNNRTYFVTTEDFELFSDPAVLVDPGFDHIDWSMTRAAGAYVAVIKEGDMQGKGVWGPIHRLEAPSATGPWAIVGDPIVTVRAEGPALARVGDEAVLYVDFYTQGRFGAYATGDWETWRDISGEVRTVRGQRHGSILPISRGTLEGLLSGP